MTKSSALKLTAVLSALIFLLPLYNIAGAQPVQTEAEEDSLFFEKTLQYIYHRNLQFSAEAYLYESYLVWLYEGINDELNKRRKEDWQNALQAFEPVDEGTLNDSLFWQEVDFDSTSHREAYLHWEQQQREKFRTKYATARHVKDNLIRSASSAQKKRMFNHDLETAFYAYRKGQYNLAVLRFNEAIDRYGYDNLADIRFYRGEAFFAQAMYERAMDDYALAVEGLDDKEMRLNARQRLMSIAGHQNNLNAMNNHWDAYVEDVGELTDDKKMKRIRSHYYETLSLLANFRMAMEEWGQAKEAWQMYEDPKSGYYATGKLRAADCALALGELDEAQHIYKELRSGTVKAHDMSQLIEREALLKLGYIDYLRENHFSAYAKLAQISGYDEIAEKAAVLSAWAVFKVHDYDKVISICNEFLDKYSDTEYFYEIFCLMGYSEEVLGRQDSALTDYRVVMGAVDDKRAYQSMNFEKMNLTRSLGELQMLEPAMFGGSRDSDFGRYRGLQQKLRMLMAQIKLAQGTRASTEVYDLIAELKNLHKAYEDIEALGEEMFESKDARLIRAYNLLTNKVTRLADDLNAAINYQLQRKTLIQREEAHKFGSRIGDSLLVHFRSEWESNENSLAQVRGLMLEAEQIDDAEILAELSEVELSLINQQQQLLRVKPHLQTIGGTEVSSHLDWWSWFAFQRHSTSGLAFDHLYVREKRQVELDQYIERINNILAERRAGVVEEVPLDSNLVLASSVGEPPYFAPKVPMWKPEVEEMPLDTAVTDTSMGMMDADTTLMDEMPVDGEMDAEMDGMDADMDAVDPEMMEDELPADEMDMEPSDDSMMEEEGEMPMDEGEVGEMPDEGMVDPESEGEMEMMDMEANDIEDTEMPVDEGIESSGEMMEEGDGEVSEEAVPEDGAADEMPLDEESENDEGQAEEAQPEGEQSMEPESDIDEGADESAEVIDETQTEEVPATEDEAGSSGEDGN